MNKTIIILLCMVTSLCSYAQKDISGKITNKAGEPLPGVTILVQGTNKGVASDFSGDYLIRDVDENTILLFSYLGFATQEISD